MPDRDGCRCEGRDVFGRRPAFYSGDDVEVQEMSLRALLHTEWPVWDLRNATFPLGFIYPIQRLAMALGVSRMAALVFAGHLSVVLAVK